MQASELIKLRLELTLFTILISHLKAASLRKLDEFHFIFSPVYSRVGVFNSSRASQITAKAIAFLAMVFLLSLFYHIFC
jgi:hypothetical protein